MSADQPTSGARRPSPRVIIGATIIFLIAISLITFALTGQTTSARGLLPLLATPTPAGKVMDQTPIAVAFSELNADPLTYLNNRIEVTGAYTPLEPKTCSRYSGPNLDWALVADALQLEAKGFERIVRILEPGTEMSVVGIWRLYQGPFGCGKGPPTGSTWYLQVQQVVQPNPLVSSGTGPQMNIENVGDQGLPALLATEIPTETATSTPEPVTATPTLTETADTLPPTVTLQVTLPGDVTLEPTITLSLTPSPNPTGTSQPGRGTPSPSPSSTITPTPGAGVTSAPTSTPDLPDLPTATEDPNAYLGEPTATNTPTNTPEGYP